MTNEHGVYLYFEGTEELANSASKNLLALGRRV